jgi:hypothetical protein
VGIAPAAIVTHLAWGSGFLTETLRPRQEGRARGTS